MGVRHRCAGLVLVALLAVAACSDDDNGEPATPSPQISGSAVATHPMEATPPSDDTAARPIDTFEPPITAADPPGGPVRFEGADFYAVPEPLPAGEPGTLLRYEPIDVFGGWSNVGDAPDAFGLQTSGTISGEVVLWRDPVAVRPERVDRPVPDETVGRSAHELAAWLAGHPELDASNPKPVSVGGLDGFEVDIAVASESTNAPALCPAGDVCVDVFAPPHLGFAWRLVTRGDRARMMLLTTADGAGTVLIAVDPFEHLGTDLESVRHPDRAAAGQHRLRRTRVRTGHRRVCARPRILPWPVATGPVHVRRVPTTVQLHGSPTNVEDGPAAWRMMYLSESIHGEAIAVTGTAVVPSTAAPDGGRPILSVAHGTTGIADQCAPSHDPSRDLAAQARFIDAGYLVAVTDYEGLGTPGRHPYLLR